MKKITTIVTVGFAICGLITNTVSAQDTIAAWTFPNTSADAIADAGLSENSARFISCEKGSGFTVLPISYTSNGADHPTIVDDKCATVSDFDNGADSAYWMVKFKTTGYNNVKVSSKQWSDNSPAGPKDFKLQYKLSGISSWTDLTTITLANDWTTGALSNYALPADFNNSTLNISLRWLMSSNVDIQGGTVVGGAFSSIDDIIITGDLIPAGIDVNTENSKLINVYPNPSNGTFIIKYAQKIKDVKVYNLLGKCVYENEFIEAGDCAITGLNSGVYLLQIKSVENAVITKRIIIE